MLTFALCQAALELMMMYDDGGQQTLMMICDRAVLEWDIRCYIVRLLQRLYHMRSYVLVVYIIQYCSTYCDNPLNCNFRVLKYEEHDVFKLRISFLLYLTYILYCLIFIGLI